MNKTNSQHLVWPTLATLLLLGSSAPALTEIKTETNNETRAQKKARILAPTTHFHKPERFEDLQGGSGTNTSRFDSNAFSLPSAALSFEQRSEFFIGNGVFDRPWVAAPSSTIASDGLGPLYNARSCQGCHIKDGRGHPPQPGDTNMVSMLFSLSDRSGAPDPVLGHQFHDQAIPGFDAEGRAQVHYKSVPFEYPDGTTIMQRKPVYKTDAQLAEGVALNPRIAPPMIGLGLVEAISDEDILARADPEDANGDGISGRANRIGKRVGRFGWKSTTATIIDQSAVAFHNDMGLSTSLMRTSYGDCTPHQKKCREALHGDDKDASGELQSEITDALLQLVTFYSANLAVPARRDVANKQVLAGKKLFYEANCTACHVPKFATSSKASKEQRNQLIWPYSDFLLHDMGPGLADKTPTGAIAGSEWRTQPLWGVGLTKVVNGHTYFLHDGRARSLEEAILWHGGEAQASRDAFAKLDKKNRQNLIRFLESL